MPQSRKNILFVSFTVLGFVACFLFPQSRPAQSQQPTSPSTQSQTPALAAESSTILISARTKDGSPVEFSTADIEIKEDGKRATVEEVHRTVGFAINYCVIFDTSGSQREKFKLQQDEAAQFLSKVVHAGRDSGILVAFSDESFLDAEGTNPQDFLKAIEKEQPRGSTALFDAVTAGANHMSESSPDKSLRLMLILSDGDDDSSRLYQDAAISALLKAGIRVYAIGQKIGQTVSLREAERAADILRRFARTTGGKAYSPSKQEDADKAVADIADQLANLFAVTYKLPDRKPDGRIPSWK